MTEFSDRSVESYVGMVASRRTMPASGSVAGVVAALAAALAHMVGAIPRDTAPELGSAVAALADLQDRALRLAVADEKSYDAWRTMQRSGKDPELSPIIQAPLDLLDCLTSIGSQLPAIAQDGQYRALSDVLAASWLVDAAVRICAENIFHNIGDTPSPAEHSAIRRLEALQKLSLTHFTATQDAVTFRRAQRPRHQSSF